MIATIISSIFKGITGAVLSWVQGILDRRTLVQQGQAQQAAAETAKAEVTSDAMRQADAQAPATDAELDQRLKDGSF